MGVCRGQGVKGGEGRGVGLEGWSSDRGVGRGPGEAVPMRWGQRNRWQHHSLDVTVTKRFVAPGVAVDL